MPVCMRTYVFCVCVCVEARVCFGHCGVADMSPSAYVSWHLRVAMMALGLLKAVQGAECRGDSQQTAALLSDSDSFTCFMLAHIQYVC